MRHHYCYFDNSLPNTWQFMVDLIYRLLICEIIQLFPANILIKRNELSFNGIEDFCYHLALQNPMDCATVFDEPCAWSGVSILLSDKGKNLIQQYFPITAVEYYGQDLYLNIEFIEKLEHIFAINHVEFDGNILIPIVND